MITDNTDVTNDKNAKAMMNKNEQSIHGKKKEVGDNIPRIFSGRWEKHIDRELEWKVSVNT